MRSNSEREKSQLSKILEKHALITKELEALRSDYHLLEAKVNIFYLSHFFKGLIQSLLKTTNLQ